MPNPIDTPAATTFGTTSARQVVGCRVCGRTLLMGERSVGFFTPAGDGPFDVCELCVPRAHRFGLRPRPSTSDEVAQARRGGFMSRVTGMFGERASSRQPRRRSVQPEPSAQGSAAVAAAAAATASGKKRRSKRRVSASPLDQLALGAVPVGAAAIPVALAAFNQSTHARTLAGLHRTLGAPRSSVAPRSTTDREVILTVAWEIVWYQFRIMPDGIEQQRGQYLSELQPRWQRWNCIVAADGTVREQADDRASVRQDDVKSTLSEGSNR
jgi:hypothetical protein